MTPPTIAIALATYNGARFLRQQLDSIITQTQRPDELVARDDGSTDCTMQILKRFAKQAPFPVHVERHTRRLGYGDNFMTAALHCEADAIAFADQDDVWMPEKLERLLGEMQRSGASLVAHSYDVVDDALRCVAPGPIRRRTWVAPNGIPPRVGCIGASMLFDRALLDLVPDHYARPRDVNVPEYGMPHDAWILLLSTLYGGALLLPDRLALYRQHGTNAVGVPRRDLRSHARLLRGAGYAHYRWYAEVCGRRADELIRLARRPEVSSPVATLMAKRAGIEATRARATFTRSDIYNRDSSCRERTITWFRLLTSGSYGDRRVGGLGSLAALKDAAVAVGGPSLPIISDATSD